MRGKFNSSITRVRPVFQRLFKLDKSGQSWLADLLRLESLNDFSKQLASNPGTIDDNLLEKRIYKDRILMHYGCGPIHLEECFEYSIHPPYSFLKWLIKNPEKMNSDQLGKNIASGKTKLMRENLFGKRGLSSQKTARETALSELRKYGAKQSKRKWWAFEGFTEVDCYLETESLILLIEGKRSEKIARSTMWYPERNQIIRNLEAAEEYSNGREFAVLVISENQLKPISEEEINSSLPHYDVKKRKDLMKHFLGFTTWEKLCSKTNIPFDSLPYSIEDILRHCRAS